MGEDLNKLGQRVGRDKFFDILRDKGLLVIRKKKFQKTTNSYHRFRKHKNILQHKKLTGPDQAYVSDITYIRIRQKFVYLFLITDAYSRLIVGWNLSESLGIEGALVAARKAIKSCGNARGIVHHSDRGLQYCCPQYEKLLTENGIQISMTEINHCYENALAERVNGILKDEFFLDEELPDLKTAKRAVSQAIEAYNTRRPHWALQLRTPIEVHQQSKYP